MSRSTPQPQEPRGPLRPPGRALTLLGVLVVALALAGVVQAVNLLRHPMPDDLPLVPELDDPAADPRTEVECEEPAVGALVTSNELFDCPAEHHGRRVRYRGEAVGAVLDRADGAWVQLNDDIYAEARGPLPAHRDYAGGNAGVGAFLPAGLAAEIGLLGGPQHRGDVLEVEGEFRRIDHERREVAVIVVSEGTVVQRGRPIADPVLPERRGIAIALALLALAVAVAERLVARRRA
jgi:hypothetical protein